MFVRDNVKSVARAIFDFGSIEDLTGRTVWSMNFDKMQPAGGALKNQQEDDILALKKGVYWLKYHTDESHSPGHWDDAPPRDSFYGIRIAYRSVNLPRARCLMSHTMSFADQEKRRFNITFSLSRILHYFLSSCQKKRISFSSLS